MYQKVKEVITLSMALVPEMVIHHLVQLQAIMEMATVFNLEHRFSATSGVAGLLNNGTTIHHLLGQQGELTGAQPNVNKIRVRNGNARVIIVDEVCVCCAREKYTHMASCFVLFGILKLNVVCR